MTVPPSTGMSVATRPDDLTPPVSTENLKANLAQFKADRAVVVEFLRDHLEEAEYDNRGNPIAGKLGDYYKVANDPNQKALTKRGSSKVMQLFRWHRGATKRVSGEETKGYCSATIEVPLLDKWGHTVGSGIGSCNTAEKRFTSIGSIKKYGGWAEQQQNAPAKIVRDPDYRAALHDVTSIATKRATTQATIVAAALEEMFTVATEDEQREEKQDEREPAQYPGQPTAARLPAKRFGKHAGKPIAEVQPTEDLLLIRNWMRGIGAKASKTPAAWAPLADAIDVELDARRQEPPADDDLPL